MLQTEHPSPVRNVEGVDPVGSPESIQVLYQAALDFLRRQYPVIFFAVVAMFGLGVIYDFTTPAKYTATAALLIDTSQIRMFQQQSMVADMPVDASTVESQVEILKSDTVALAVIKKLNLTNDPEFTGGGGGLIGVFLSGITSLFGFSAPTSDVVSAHRAIGAFQSRLNVKRVGLTYIIGISFTSLSPERAAQIANAVADAYIDDQLESKYQAARRAGSWLQERLGELRQQATTAQRAVVDFKNKNNMIDAGGRTINEQQLAELNSELILAQSQTAEARAKVDRVQSILTSSSPDAAVDATVADSLKDNVINELRTQYLQLARREADWASKYGANHLAVINVRNQMNEIQNSIRAELQRIAETYKSDYEVARQREDSIQKQLQQAVSQSQVTNQAQVALRELETSAQSYQSLYDNFLQRYMESVQQQSFPITEARVISPASRPSSPSHPRTMIVLGVALLAGLALGGVAGAWREISDRVFRTRKQVEDILQTDCIALIPVLTKTSKETIGASKADVRSSTAGLFDKALGRRLLRKIGELSQDKIVDLNYWDDAGGRGGSERDNISASDAPVRQKSAVVHARLLEPGLQRIVPVAGPYMAVLDAPFSAFAEAIRSIKVAIDLSPTAAGAKVVGFTSSVPNEGKSSIAAALARLTAQTGARTLLVDCDLKNPSLSRSLSPRVFGGLLEAVRGQTSVEKASWVDDATKLKFLPAATKARLAHSSEILASPVTRKFFDGLRQSYDYIILDFAPLMPIVDVRAATHLVDGYVYVIEWGKTRIDHVEQALHTARGVYEHLYGVVLNKVDLWALGRYDGRGDGYYHHGSYYGRYGYTE
jgi:succinoglycan biosynthesis transport protein ExoP